MEFAKDFDDKDKNLKLKIEISNNLMNNFYTENYLNENNVNNNKNYFSIKFSYFSRKNLL